MEQTASAEHTVSEYVVAAETVNCVDVQDVMFVQPRFEVAVAFAAIKVVRRSHTLNAEHTRLEVGVGDSLSYSNAVLQTSTPLQVGGGDATKGSPEFMYCPSAQSFQ